MIESLKQLFGVRRDRAEGMHKCPHCGAGLEDMELLNGQIHSRGRGRTRCRMDIRCLSCHRFHAYREPGIQAAMVWYRLEQRSVYQEKAMRKLQVLRLRGRIGYGCV